MTRLARKLHLPDYFALAFGTMVGAGWLVVMDDWLARGGPLGVVLGFAVGGVLLLPVGHVYGRLVMAIPDAASEIAYAGRVFAPWVSFATGWVMVLAYLPVCPWEAVAVGKIASYIWPSLNSIKLFTVYGRPVYLPHLAIGLGLTAIITGLNYRGIRLSATFQSWTTFSLLALFAIFVSCGLARGSYPNFQPFFSRGGLVSVILVLQIVPYFMTGFEAVPKCAEEARPGFPVRDFFRAILLALVSGAVFYILVTAVVAYVHPWRALVSERFATAVAFERAFRARWIVDLVLAAALISLVKIFNGNFIAASRLLFALGRRGHVAARFGSIHPINQTPAFAVVFAGLLTAGATFLGESILVPITEVCSLASAGGWMATCAAYWRLAPTARERAIAAAGALVSGLLLLIKVLPFVPGHFNRFEYLALAVWVLAGLLLNLRERVRAAGPPTADSSFGEKG